MTDIERCGVCEHTKYMSPILPKLAKYETHQVATMGDVRVNICYGGCLHEPGRPNYHAWAAPPVLQEEPRQ